MGTAVDISHSNKYVEDGLGGLVKLIESNDIVGVGVDPGDSCSCVVEGALDLIMLGGTRGSVLFC